MWVLDLLLLHIFDRKRTIFLRIALICRTFMEDRWSALRTQLLLNFSFKLNNLSLKFLHIFFLPIPRQLSSYPILLFLQLNFFLPTNFIFLFLVGLTLLRTRCILFLLDSLFANIFCFFYPWYSLLRGLQWFGCLWDNGGACLGGELIHISEIK